MKVLSKFVVNGNKGGTRLNQLSQHAPNQLSNYTVLRIEIRKT